MTTPECLFFSVATWIRVSRFQFSVLLQAPQSGLISQRAEAELVIKDHANITQAAISLRVGQQSCRAYSLQIKLALLISLSRSHTDKHTQTWSQKLLGFSFQHTHKITKLWGFSRAHTHKYWQKGRQRKRAPQFCHGVCKLIMQSYGRTLFRVIEGEGCFCPEPTPSGPGCQNAMAGTALRLVPTSDKAISQKQEQWQ